VRRTTRLTSAATSRGEGSRLGTDDLDHSMAYIIHANSQDAVLRGISDPYLQLRGRGGVGNSAATVHGRHIVVGHRVLRDVVDYVDLR